MFDSNFASYFYCLMDSNFESWSQRCIFEIIFLSWFQTCNSETTIQYLTPSDNENKMREDLPKFEDSMFFLDELSQNIKFKTLKLKNSSLHFGIFSTVFLTFQMKSLIHRMTMKLIWNIDLKQNRNRKLTVR